MGLLSGLASFLAVLLGSPVLASVTRPAEMPALPVQDEAQVTSAVRQGVEKGRIAIQKVKDLVPGVICHQVPVGETMIVKLVAGRDYYAKGKFMLADSPQVSELALGVSDVYGVFSNVRSNQFKITFSATGTADAIPVQGRIDYAGLPLSCIVVNRSLSLEVKTLNNELLACARAAALAEDLMLEKKMPIHVDLKGQEFGEKGGRFRSVDVEITFIGLLRYAPDADFCG